MTLEFNSNASKRCRWKLQTVHTQGVVARAVVRLLRKQRFRDRPMHTAHSFVEKKFPLTLIQEEQVVCQLLAKEWALNIGKLPQGGFTRNSVVK